MSKNLQLSLTMAFNGSAVTNGLSQMQRQLRTLEGTGRQAFTGMTSKVREFSSALNGFGAISKLASAYSAMLGMGGMKSVIDDNLTFERLLLKIKFNAQATTKELAEMKKTALNLSKTTLNSPLEVLQIQQRLANAGMKMPDIRQLTPTIANAAQVFEAPAAEIADLVFDMTTKSGIKNERVPQMLDMLYAHATSGRFETMDLAKQSPALLNAGARVGLDNEKGLNLMGALTQRLMRNATVQNPAEVTTLAEHGLSHITDPHYVKSLGKVGIDVKSYFDNKGHFKGEGGMEGIIALTRAMKAKGLDNPFKMGEAGFREQYTRTFWLEMIRSIEAKDTDKDPNLVNMMDRGKEAMESGQLAKNLIEMKESNFGKIKGAEIEVQKAKLSEPAAKATGLVASTVAWAGNNMGTAAMLTAGGAIAARLAYKGIAAKMGGRGGAGLAAAAGGALGVQRVFVTNFPSSMLSPKEQLQKNRERVPGKDGGGTIAGEAVKVPGKGARFAGGAKGALKYGAPLAIGMGLIEGLMTANDSTLSKEAKATEYKRIAGGTAGSIAGGVLGGAIGALFGGFGAIPGAMIGSAAGNWGGEKLAALFSENKSVMDKMATTPIPVVVTVNVENGNIVAAVTEAQNKKALRN